jgi:hypothetical protein
MIRILFRHSQRLAGLMLLVALAAVAAPAQTPARTKDNKAPSKEGAGVVRRETGEVPVVAQKAKDAAGSPQKAPQKQEEARLAEEERDPNKPTRKRTTKPAGGKPTPQDPVRRRQ